MQDFNSLLTDENTP